MRELCSLKNPVIQAARALQTAKGRREQGAFLLEGEHMTGEALTVCPGKVRALFVDSAALDRYAGLTAQAPADAEVYAVPSHVLEGISQVKTPQGVAAVCALPQAAALENQGQRLVLLENVQDPGNVGTILRTLDAAGFHGCALTPGCADPYAPKTLRATMGSVFRVPLSLVPDGPEAVAQLNALGYCTLGAELHGEPFYDRGPLPEKVCLCIGNEGAGLSRALLNECAKRFKLPMRGGAESLNAGVAAAVFMYDIMNR